jgi:hypothetical protein
MWRNFPTIKAREATEILRRALSATLPGTQATPAPDRGLCSAEAVGFQLEMAPLGSSKRADGPSPAAGGRECISPSRRECVPAGARERIQTVDRRWLAPLAMG